MTQRLNVVHTTTITYQGDVIASFNEARMTPLTADGQLLLRHQLAVEPAARISHYTDYWGTAVETFDVHHAHRSLTVTATSVVDTLPTWSPAPGATWQELEAPEIRDKYCEYLEFSNYVDDAKLDPSRVRLVEAMRACPEPRTAIDLAITSVRNRIAYAPGVTHVHSTAAHAWAQGRGVCQDFSHNTLSLLRAAGIPARYVSGYVHSEDAAVGVEGIGESHAWIEVWNGGWEGHDPTNGRPVGPSHVLVARGRDYDDVSPLRGIYAGPRSGDPHVVVAVTRLQ